MFKNRFSIKRRIRVVRTNFPSVLRSTGGAAVTYCRLGRNYKTSDRQ